MDKETPGQNGLYKMKSTSKGFTRKRIHGDFKKSAQDNLSVLKIHIHLMTASKYVEQKQGETLVLEMLIPYNNKNGQNPEQTREI